MGEFERLERFDDVVARRRRSFELLGGGPVVDVGCGTGTAARELAARHGRAIGRGRQRGDWEDHGVVGSLAADAAVQAGALDREAADAWLAEQARRGAQGRFQMTMTHMLTAGTRP
ncbi:MAG: hypothetical protein ACXVFT_18775 [Solirubrobacteraceae bacterium]